MTIFIIIVLALAAAGLIIYFGELRFEYTIELNKKDISNKKNTSLDCLSSTELRIFKLLSEGKTNQEIADSLFISVHTVKKHVSNIFKKLNLKSRNDTRKFKELIDSNI